MSAARDTPDDQWIESFEKELRLRDASLNAVADAIRTVRDLVAHSDQNADDAFGDPRAYAHALDLPTEPRPTRFATLLLVGVAIVAFIVSTLSATRWIGGDTTSSVVAWTLGSSIALVAASIWLTITFARNAIDHALRERFSATTSSKWSTWVPLTVAIPWLFPLLAGTVIAVLAART